MKIKISYYVLFLCYKIDKEFNLKDLNLSKTLLTEFIKYADN